MLAPRGPARCAVLAEVHLAFDRLALDPSVEAVTQASPLVRQAAAQAHSIAIHLPANGALESSSDMTAYHVVAGGDEEEAVASRSPAVLHIDVPASRHVRSRRRRHPCGHALRRLTQYLGDAAAGQDLISGTDCRRTNAERGAVARGV